MNPKRFNAPLLQLISLFLVCTFTALSVSAESKEPATDFLKQGVSSVLMITAVPISSPKAKTELDAKLLTLIKPMMDFPAMSEASLGKHWVTINAKQRQRFISLFQDLVFHSYMKKIRSAKNEAKIEYEDESPRSGGGAEVEAIATTSKEVEVELRFILRAGKTKSGEAAFVAEDIVIDEVSLVTNYREEFNRIIAKEGFDGLLKKMERQVAKVSGAK